ncbi:electron transport protein [Metabacillus fastidiosus]|uniref:electron transport protein n=1 Tax=Metabacillus fastidiosus TaxID=1458 RepID=UPI002DC0233A|nr:electron transport protein [Metabacillus fastidiosus]MEC2074944.1 electron transport protein [Metabacillus fastidiosus]
MRLKQWLFISIALFLSALIFIFFFLHIQFDYTPEKEEVDAHKVNNRNGYDYWGEYMSNEYAEQLLETEVGKDKLLEKNGAVKIDNKLLELGRKTFYTETFGNERFLTDVMGIIDGPLTIGNIMRALIALKGEGTTNLQVELAEDIKLGNKVYRKGELIDTGIDVAKGSYLPIGFPVTVSAGEIKMGISCAACHATFDPHTKKVIEGAPNTDFNGGLLMALATNSAAYFTHADIENIKKYIKDSSRTIENSEGKTEKLPDPESLERAVDETFIKWPRGNFDTTIDLASNPIQIPDAFTLNDHPYSWSGFAAVGNFKGLSTFNNNVHAQNTDSLTQAELSKELFGMDKEVYIGTILQKAAHKKYRYKTSMGVKPSNFLKERGPTRGADGLSDVIESPNYPKVSYVAPDGFIASSPGYKFSEQVNALSAWQNTLQPPERKGTFNNKIVLEGKEVFKRANCIACHAGQALTNNKIISVNKIGTEPSRAKAFKKTEKIFGESVLYSLDTPVPLSKKPKILKVPIEHLDKEQLEMGFAHGDSQGGYKVPSLIGLYWSAPYLHEGGVAVGVNINNDIGVPGTLLKGKTPDPYNSLKALVDRQLRNKVVQANKTSIELKKVHITGEGHDFWVDEEAGFTSEEQEKLIEYLLSLTSITNNE